MSRYPFFFLELRPIQFYLILHKPNRLKFAQCVQIELQVKSCNHPSSSRIINITNHALQFVNYTFYSSSNIIISLSRQELNTSTIKILVTVNILQRSAMSGSLLSDVAWVAHLDRRQKNSF